MKSHLLDALIKISAEINSTMELDTLLPDIVKITGDYLKVKNASIMLINWESLTISRYTENVPRNNSYSLKEGITGDIASSGTEYIVNRRQDSTHNSVSFVALPLKAGSKILGVFNLTDKEGNYFSDDDVSIAKYIASQCALAIERYNIYKKMRANENLQAIGLLKSSVAHDISNLLGIAEVYLTLMEEESHNNGQMLEYISAVKSEMKRISILATDMLDLSKDKLELHKIKFKISELVSELKMYTNAFSKDSKISIEYRIKDDIEIFADKNRLFRVFFNLMKNSSEVLNDTGKIIFTAKKVKNEIYIGVYDTGKGIDKDDIKNLFHPFFTSGKEKGTGLGLAIVHDIIKAHGGTIGVRSYKEHYTYFVVRIPING